MCASVIAGVDAPPVLEAREEVFDLVPLSVELFVEVGWSVSSFAWRYAWRDALGFERGTVFIAVIALVADHHTVTLRQRGVEQLCALVVAHLPFGQAQGHRPAFTIADSVQFGVQAPFGASNTSG